MKHTSTIGSDKKPAITAVLLTDQRPRTCRNSGLSRSPTVVQLDCGSLLLYDKDNLSSPGIPAPTSDRPCRWDAVSRLSTGAHCSTFSSRLKHIVSAKLTVSPDTVFSYCHCPPPGVRVYHCTDIIADMLRVGKEGHTNGNLLQ